jgi:hypothetical protein
VVAGKIDRAAAVRHTKLVIANDVKKVCCTHPLSALKFKCAARLRFQSLGSFGLMKNRICLRLI